MTTYKMIELFAGIGGQRDVASRWYAFKSLEKFCVSLRSNVEKSEASKCRNTK